MRVLAMVTGVLAVIGGCSEGGETPSVGADVKASASAPAGTATAEPVTRETVYAAAAEGPEPFVRAIYAQYVAGGPQGEPPAPGRDPMFSRIMNALIGADVRAANGGVPTLHYDPFCVCQDQGEFALTALAVAQAAPNAAEANVTFTNMGKTKTLTLELVREGVNWKVADIVDGGRSLHDELMKVAETA